jgi:hypothetical protein
MMYHGVLVARPAAGDDLVGEAKRRGTAERRTLNSEPLSPGTYAFAFFNPQQLYYDSVAKYGPGRSDQLDARARLKWAVLHQIRTRSEDVSQPPLWCASCGRELARGESPGWIFFNEPEDYANIVGVIGYCCPGNEQTRKQAMENTLNMDARELKMN